MQKLIKDFKYVLPGEIYPTLVKKGEDCPRGYEAAARKWGCLPSDADNEQPAPETDLNPEADEQPAAETDLNPEAGEQFAAETDLNPEADEHLADGLPDQKQPSTKGGKKGGKK